MRKVICKWGEVRFRASGDNVSLVDGLIVAVMLAPRKLRHQKDTQPHLADIFRIGTSGRARRATVNLETLVIVCC